MALHISDVDAPRPTPATVAVPRPRPGSIVELRGSRSEHPAGDLDSLVEMIRLRTEIADRDRRIATLSLGVRTWRERAHAEARARRAEALEAHEREREIVTLLHHQMQVADAATAELEAMRRRSFWQRLRG
ncbi:MAG: hypothetical protein ACYDAC_09645 [Candidatus Dormibacteria bacterium]